MNNRGCFRLRARSGSPGSAAPRPSRTHRLVSVLDLDYIVTLPSHLCQVFSAKFITELLQHSLLFFSPVFRHFSLLPPVPSPFPARHLLQIFFANLFPTCFNFMPHSRFRPALFHFLSHFHFRPALFHFLSYSYFRTALFHFLLHSRLCPALFSTSFCYFQCIYNTFSVYFPARSFCPYLLHTPKVFTSSSNATLSVDSDKQKAPALR